MTKARGLRRAGGSRRRCPGRGLRRRHRAQKRDLVEYLKEI